MINAVIVCFLVTGLDACAQGNNTCQHICVSDEDSFKCKCRVGFVLNADQKSCSRKNTKFICMCIYMNVNVFILNCTKSQRNCEAVVISCPGAAVAFQCSRKNKKYKKEVGPKSKT